MKKTLYSTIIFATAMLVAFTAEAYHEDDKRQAKSFGIGYRRPGKLDYHRDYVDTPSKSVNRAIGKHQHKPFHLFVNGDKLSNNPLVTRVTVGAPQPQQLAYFATVEGSTYRIDSADAYANFMEAPKENIDRLKTIKIELYQFGYDPGYIKVEKNDIVTFVLTTRDVAHGFLIKEYDINVTVRPGEEQRISFVADKPGDFKIRCSVYCGHGHGDMKGRLRVRK